MSSETAQTRTGPAPNPASSTPPVDGMNVDDAKLAGTTGIASGIAHGTSPSNIAPGPEPEPKPREGAEPVLQVRGVGKCYQMYAKPSDRLRQSVFRWTGKKYHKDFWALRDVSFRLDKGEALGIIGRNGSGKSTLMQIIAGVLRPTTGEVEVRGRVAALLELGAGFNPEFTGRENAMLYGSILGMSRKEVERRFPEIEAFASIGHFIDQPVKTYSSGMLVRLAFSVQVQLEPEVLIIDEALSVGDAGFRAKCLRRLEMLREKGVTLLLVTHDMGVVRKWCDRAILLDGGRVVDRGDTASVAAEYYRIVQGLEVAEAPKAETGGKASEVSGDELVPAVGLDPGNRAGDGRAKIVAFNIFDAEGRPARVLRSRDEVRVNLRVQVLDDLEDAHVGVVLCDSKGRMIVGAHSMYGEHETVGCLAGARAGTTIRVSFTFPVAANPGEYLLMAGVADHTGPHLWSDCDIVHDLCEVEVVGERSWGDANVAARIDARPE